MATDQQNKDIFNSSDGIDANGLLIGLDEPPYYALGAASFYATYVDRRDKTNREVDERYGKEPRGVRDRRKREHPKPQPAQLLNESDLEDDEDELFQHFLMQHNTPSSTEWQCRLPILRTVFERIG